MNKKFRPAARLVILNENKILLCKMGNFWGLPGGGIDWGEKIDEALNRDSIEELGVNADFDEIIFIQDFMGTKDSDNHIHFIEYFCSVKNNNDFLNVTQTYKNSSHAFELHDLDWFDLENIPENMMPKTFIDVLKSYLNNKNLKTKYISGIN